MANTSVQQLEQRAATVHRTIKKLEGQERSLAEKHDQLTKEKQETAVLIATGEAKASKASEVKQLLAECTKDLTEVREEIKTYRAAYKRVSFQLTEARQAEEAKEREAKMRALEKDVHKLYKSLRVALNDGAEVLNSGNLVVLRDTAQRDLMHIVGSLDLWVTNFEDANERQPSGRELLA